MNLGFVLVEHSGDVNINRMCLEISSNPYFLIPSLSKGAGVAPRIEQLSSAAFQNIDGNNIASGYNRGMDTPHYVEHIF